VVEQLKVEYDIEIDWLPFFLHPEIPPEGMPLPEHLRARMKDSTAHLQRMAHAAGLAMVSPDRIAYSRLALEATEFARQQGQLEAFHRIVFRKYYGEGQDIGQWAVLRAAAEEAGLNPDTMQAAVDGGQFRPVIDGHLQQATEWGITAVPTYIVGETYEIVGAQPYAVFEQALAQLGVAPKPGAKA
jgi:predicted DsbA family dithiol-disulfide isomerase